MGGPGLGRTSDVSSLWRPPRRGWLCRRCSFGPPDLATVRWAAAKQQANGGRSGEFLHFIWLGFSRFSIDVLVYSISYGTNLHYAIVEVGLHVCLLRHTKTVEPRVYLVHFYLHFSYRFLLLLQWNCNRAHQVINKWFLFLDRLSYKV
jgi:hypothetical protein